MKTPLLPTRGDDLKFKKLKEASAKRLVSVIPPEKEVSPIRI